MASMSVDVALFDSLKTFEDKRVGVREEFLQPTIGGARTVGILSTPLQSPASLGWLFCHSFGLEQIYLNPMEVPMARRLAAMGFPVLRFHCQGYGDSVLPWDTVSLSSHVENTLEAVELLRETSGVERIGLFGARFGSVVAGVVADRVGAEALTAWDPIVSGRTYANALVRQELLSGLGIGDAGRQDPVEILRRDGSVDLQGYPLRLEVFEEFSSLDLTTDMVTFRGDALFIQISQSSTPRPDVRRLMDRLESLGARCRFQTVQGDRKRPLGAPRFVAVEQGVEKRDSQAQLAADLQQLTGGVVARLGTPRRRQGRR
jgi:pimeloyl-ACP methyl ester carboxylesterase